MKINHPIWQSLPSISTIWATGAGKLSVRFNWSLSNVPSLIIYYGISIWCITFQFFIYYFRTKILQQDDSKDREKLVMKFIKIMKWLRKQNNFNSYLALLSALDSAPIRRLEWQRSITEGLKEYCALIDSSSSFRAYRQAVSEST